MKGWVQGDDGKAMVEDLCDGICSVDDIAGAFHDDIRVLEKVRKGIGKNRKREVSAKAGVGAGEGLGDNDVVLVVERHSEALRHESRADDTYPESVIAFHDPPNIFLVPAP